MLLSKMGFLVFLMVSLLFQNDAAQDSGVVIEYDLGAGRQPEIAVDNKGTIRVVFGLKKGSERELYLVDSKDGGKSFSEPYLLGNFSDMGLGMGRGPQIASTGDYTVVTVGDHHGDLFAVRLTHATGKWSGPVRINDTDTTAREALSGLVGGMGNRFFAVWLDSRLGNNNLFGSQSTDGGLNWDKNTLIYKGTQNGICDCCKPSVVLGDAGQLFVMFRNKLNGARNMYLITSKDGGRHFGDAQKLGTGDYLINACPMDGGDLTADSKGIVTTVWRRQTEVFLAKPGEPEEKLGPGRTPVLVRTTKGIAMAWQDGEIRFRVPDGSKTISLGKGQYPRLAMQADGKSVICAFERDGRVVVTTVLL